MSVKIVVKFKLWERNCKECICFQTQEVMANAGTSACARTLTCGRCFKSGAVKKKKKKVLQLPALSFFALFVLSVAVWAPLSSCLLCLGVYFTLRVTFFRSNGLCPL